jgi:hypothetical protein
MSSIPYPSLIVPPADGQSVNAAVTGLPLQQLAERTDSLQQVMLNAQFGSTLFSRNQPVTSDSLPGMAVYRGNDGNWNKAVFAFSADSKGDYSIDITSWVGGVIAAKSSSTLADIATMGEWVLSGSQLAAVCESGTAETGQLFLSSNRAGFLTSLTPPVGIQVAFCSGPDADANYHLLVGALPRNLVESHIHYRVPLTMAAINPATTGAVGWVNTTTYASWFSTNNIPIPAGAVWYYLVDNDLKLSRLWPPSPIGVAELQRNGVAMRLDGTGAEALINYYGIWYFSATYPPTGSQSVGASAGLFIVGGEPDRIDLLFIRQFGKTQVVTSLDAADATVVITDPTGIPANTGALQIRAQLPLDPSDNWPGALAIKQVNKMVQQRGIVLEGIKTASGSGLVISGGTPVSEGLDIDGNAIAATGFIGGRLTLGFDNPTFVFEDSLDAVAFDNVDVTEQVNGTGIFGFLFRQNQDGSVQGRCKVPHRGVPTGGCNLVIEMTVLAKASGTLPVMSVTLYKLPEPNEVCGDVAYVLSLPVSSTTFNDMDLGSCSGTAFTVSAGQYLKHTSDPVTVLPGDTLCFTFTRLGSSDGYSGDLAILDLRYRLLLS